MEEREICCCGARGWTLVIAWIQIISSVLMLLFFAKIGIDVVEVDKPNLDSIKELGLTPAFAMGLIVMTVVNITMAVILIRGCKNENLKQLNIWLKYAKIILIILVSSFIGRSFIIPVEQALRHILSFCVELVIQIFCIWVVGIHKGEIGASSGTVVAYKA